jgi:hypothetical protein
MVLEEVLSVEGDDGVRSGTGAPDGDEKSGALPGAPAFGSLSASAAGTSGQFVSPSGGVAGSAGGAPAFASSSAAAGTGRYAKRYGPVPPPTAHQEEIVDLRAIEYPVKMLATAAKDGTIKIWV